jgi:putative membrane protein
MHRAEPGIRRNIVVAAAVIGCVDHPTKEVPMRRAAITAVLAVSLAGCANGMMGGSGGGGTAAATQDQTFVAQAARAGMTEMHLGRLGMQKASDPQVRAFAQMMAADHARNSEALRATAAAKGVPMPAQPAAEQQSAMMKLSEMTGPAFDKAYMDQMVAEHQKAVSLYQRQSESGTDPALKSYAQQSLPTLREHLDMARSLAEKQRG